MGKQAQALARRNSADRFDGVDRSEFEHVETLSEPIGGHHRFAGKVSEGRIYKARDVVAATGLDTKVKKRIHDARAAADVTGDVLAHGSDEGLQIAHTHDNSSSTRDVPTNGVTSVPQVSRTKYLLIGTGLADSTGTR